MSFLSEPSLVVALIEVVIGVLVLSRAGDDFVEGAVDLAAGAKLSPVLVGAVVIGFGTSAPEMVVSGLAAYNGNLDLGVGNVVGSNVANLSLVLATAALIVPVLVTRAVLAREAPMALMSVILFAYLASDGLSRSDGWILMGGLAVILTWSIAASGSYDAGVDTLERDQPLERSVAIKDIGRTLAGLIGTIVGAQLLVWGAIGIAGVVGLSGGFIGFTLVAVGTSLPELVTAVVAARKNQTDLILGNLLGSNMFNSLGVGGLIGLISPGVISDDGLRRVGLVVMVGVSVLAWMAMVSRRRVYRAEGGLLIVVWLAAVLALAYTTEDSVGALIALFD